MFFVKYMIILIRKFIEYLIFLLRYFFLKLELDEVKKKRKELKMMCL